MFTGLLATGFSVNSARAEESTGPSCEEGSGLVCEESSGSSCEELPDWVWFQNQEIILDFERDGSYEDAALIGGELRIYSMGSDASPVLRYESPAEWIVTSCLASDLDQDGCEEMILLTWKKGSFGPYHPYWIDEEWLKEDEKTWSEHVFILSWTDEGLKQRWMSSALGFEAQYMFRDEDGRIHFRTPEGEENVWTWSYWGLSLVSIEEEPQTVSFLDVGDNIAHQGIYEAAYVPEERSFDFHPVYEQVAARIRSYDLAAVHQETIFVADPAGRSDFPVFGTPMTMGEALADAGFDIVAAASNHANDKGTKGIRDTIAFWEQYPEVHLLGLHATEEDADQAEVAEAGGIRIALFDSTYGLNGRPLPEDEAWRIDVFTDQPEKLTDDLSAQEADVDLSICFLHAGEEYEEMPGEELLDYCRKLIDAGADVILCSHPHVVQPVLTLVTASGNQGLVYCSLGNFLARQTEWERQLGGAAELLLAKDGIVRWDFLPTICHYSGNVTQCYFLEDYTDALASEHYLSRVKKAMTVSELWELWNLVGKPAVMKYNDSDYLP